MSSGFVSGGTSDAPVDRSDEWLAAQREIEANILQKREASRQAATGKSLYETLEANKAAKQEAFEEANRLKNQFRALDADEVDFLDSVLESTRAEEERVRRETAEGLELFRKQQERADGRLKVETGPEAGGDGDMDAGEGSWGTGGRKRKRVKEREGLKGVKIRRASTAEKSMEGAAVAPVSKVKSGSRERSGADLGPAKAPVPSSDAGVSQTKSEAKPPPAAAKGSLVSYGSDEDEDDW